MRSSSPSEERFPLLLLFLEDSQRSTKNKRILIDKNRYHGITSGASAVITQWPGHLTACWLTSIVIGLGIIFLSMTMFAVSLRPAMYMLGAKCKHNNVYHGINQTSTVYLVHGQNLWSKSQLEMLNQIVKNYPQSNVTLTIILDETDFKTKRKFTNVTWQPVAQLDLKRFSKEDNLITNPGSTTIKASNSSLQAGNKPLTTNNLKRLKRLKRFTKIGRSDANKLHQWENIQLNINIGTKQLMKMLLKRQNHDYAVLKPQNHTKLTDKTPAKEETFSGIIAKYPNIYLTNTTYRELFQHSPLSLTWQNLNKRTRIFAVRVLQMWDYGGITFDLPDSTTLLIQNRTSLERAIDSSNALDDDDSSPEKLKYEIPGKYKKLIRVGLTSFHNLPEGLVTIDDEGFHMETKTICHVYFGELIMNLRTATRETTPSSLIKKTLRKFCMRGSVNPEYCKTVIR